VREPGPCREPVRTWQCSCLVTRPNGVVSLSCHATRDRSLASEGYGLKQQVGLLISGSVSARCREGCVCMVCDVVLRKRVCGPVSGTEPPSYGRALRRCVGRSRRATDTPAAPSEMEPPRCRWRAAEVRRAGLRAGGCTRRARGAILAIGMCVNVCWRDER
jgi:hypothetical protein